MFVCYHCGTQPDCAKHYSMCRCFRLRVFGETMTIFVAEGQERSGLGTVMRCDDQCRRTILGSRSNDFKDMSPEDDGETFRQAVLDSEILKVLIS